MNDVYYAFTDPCEDSCLILAPTKMLDKYYNKVVQYNMETKFFDVVEWYDGSDQNIIGSFEDPRIAFEKLKELT